MNDCWNFFKYANNSDLNKIIILFKKNKWLSKYEKNYLKEKVDKKECIYESGDKVQLDQPDWGVKVIKSWATKRKEKGLSLDYTGKDL